MRRFNFSLKINTFFGFFLAILGTLALGVTPSFPGGTTPVYAASDVDNFYFSDLTVDYYLSRADDGTSRLHVVEQLTAEFPSYDQNRGFIRSIPDTNNDGTNVTIPSADSLNLTATRNGTSERVLDKIIYNRDAGSYDIYLQDPNAYVHGTQKYVLEYDMEHVIIGVDAQNRAASFASDTHLLRQEFYWDTNGTDWRQRFDHITANVHFVDLELSDVLDPATAAAHAAGETTGTSCYTGSYGDNAHDCAITPISDGYSFTTTRPLDAYENLTIDVELAADAFALPVYTVTIRDFLPLIFWGVTLLVIAALIIIIWAHHHRLTKDNRRYYQSLLKPMQYLPPKDLTVGQAAYFVLSKPVQTGAINTLLELAVRHKIELIKTTSQGFFSKTTWQIRIKDLTGLSKSEKAILRLAGNSSSGLEVGTVLTLKSYPASSRRRSLAASVSSSDRAALRKLKLLKTDAALTKGRTGSLLLVVVLMFGVMFLFPAFISTYDWVFGKVDGLCVFTVMLLVILIFKALTVFINGSQSPYAQLTKQGMEMVAYLDGLREYIQLAETDRLNFLQSVQGADTSPQGVVKLYERLLPYAALFGCEKSWLKELGQYYANLNLAPAWCESDNQPDTAVFLFTANDFSSLRHASSISTFGGSSSSGGSGSSSSSSGGGGGGGFSGGGGGGGGGRGL